MVPIKKDKDPPDFPEPEKLEYIAGFVAVLLIMGVLLAECSPFV